MAFPFIFGDSYGGVQQAQQADVNSDRNFLTSLLAAQQAAQRMAFEQQSAASQRAQENWRSQAQIDQQNQDRALREELGLAGLDTAQDKINAAQQIAAEKIQAAQDLAGQKIADAEQQKFDQAQSAGPVLASRFADVIKANKDAEDNLAKSQSDYLALDQDVGAKLAQGLLKKVKGTGNETVYAASGADDKAIQAMKPEADRINSKLRELTAQINEAKARKMQAERDLQQHMRMIASSGFLPSEQGIVYPKTQQVFPFPSSVNSPRIRSYNPSTGTLD